MADTRRRDVDWQIPGVMSDGVSCEVAQLAVLMDIRDELKRLNALLHCDNFLSIPRILRRVSANTGKPRKKAADA